MTALAGPDVFYVDTGGDDPVIVFSHGFLMDHEMFEGQVDALREEFRCISWDQRGHGRTASTGPFTFWDSARDLLALLDRSGVDSAFLVGMSQGGYVSARAALLAPERVAGLVFIDSQAGLEAEDRRPLYDVLFQSWTTEGASEDIAATVAAIILGPHVDPQPWTEKWVARPPEALTDPYRALMGRDDISARLGEIACPALVVHGKEDAAIGIEKAEFLCEGLANCEGLVRIAGAAHASNVSHPAEVNAALRDFLHHHAYDAESSGD